MNSSKNISVDTFSLIRQGKWKAYSFLFRPIFFIFSLLFACWLVLKIEKLSPSDFGKYKALFENDTTNNQSHRKKVENIPREIGSENSRKLEIKKLIFNYKKGLVDSAMFESKFEEFFMD